MVAIEYGQHDRYIPNVEMIFVGFGILGSVVGLALNIVDFKMYGSVLNRNSRVKVPLGSDDPHAEALLDPNRTEL